MAKVRLDVLLVERGLIETREKAKRTIMAGLVYSGQDRLDKPGMKVDDTADLTVKGKVIPYVGRGGLKLEKALDYFGIDVTGRTMVDIGSSTGDSPIAPCSVVLHAAMPSMSATISLIGNCATIRV